MVFVAEADCENSLLALNYPIIRVVILLVARKDGLQRQQVKRFWDGW